MKRGEVWTISGSGYAGKPRPAPELVRLNRAIAVFLGLA